MSRASALAVCLMSGWCVEAARCAAPPARNPFSERFHKTKPTNGVSFATTAAVEGEELTVRWCLGYVGQRSPAVVLAPTLTHGTVSQTALLVFGRDADGKVYRVEFVSPCNYGFNQPAREWFLTMPSNSCVEGVVKLPLEELRKAFVEEYPKQFGGWPPESLSCQLVHRPTDRGTAYDLDAWTGELVGGMAKFEVRQWPRSAQMVPLLSGRDRRWCREHGMPEIPGIHEDVRAWLGRWVSRDAGW